MWFCAMPKSWPATSNPQDRSPSGLPRASQVTFEERIHAAWLYELLLPHAVKDEMAPYTKAVP
jgi:hypothetical protein